MKKAAILLLVIFISTLSFAQKATESNSSDTTKHWKTGGVGNVNFSQGYLKNWVEGGENSVSALSILSLYTNYAKGKQNWDNTLDLKFGVLQSGDQNLRKNEDKIELTTKFGQKAFKSWYYAILGSFKSQMFNGYDYPNDSVAISRFMSPAYTFLSLGLDYKPNDKISVLISPITSKSTYVLDTVKFDQTRYGLEKDERIRMEFGGYIKTLVKLDLTENILLENKFDLFSNYAEHPEHIDVNWEVVINMTVSKYITTTISAHLIYDHDIDVPVFEEINGENIQTGNTKAIQFKELLAIGLSYKF